MTFDSTRSPIAVLQRIAQTCRSLVILTFRSDLSPGDSFDDPVNWSTLQELQLAFKVDRRWGEPAADHDLPFHTLIQGAPHLTHLQIIGYHILGAEALSRCLQAAPSLTILKLQPERSPRWPSPGVVRSQMPLEDVIVPPPDWVPKLLASLNELGSCPQLEVLDCGRCRTKDVTPILEFVQDESRLSKIKRFQADLGKLAVQQVHTTTSPRLLESLRSLQTAHGISVDLKWVEIEPTPEPRWEMDPYSGLSVLATSPWEDEDDW
ncbi:hypothetical protein PQX77_014707 [Marasmius sp. AFHP31]|nr:hypothetical protein PQX77_014707 [Marasmius sp. AFHP31]